VPAPRPDRVLVVGFAQVWALALFALEQNKEQYVRSEMGRPSEIGRLNPQPFLLKATRNSEQSGLTLLARVGVSRLFIFRIRKSGTPSGQDRVIALHACIICLRPASKLQHAPT